MKDYRSDLLTRLSWIREARPFGHTTQMVLGAAGETDREVYRRIAWALRQDAGLPRDLRALPSTGRDPDGSPSPGTVLEGLAVESAGFTRADRTGSARRSWRPSFDGDGMLLNRDPKEVLAERHGPVDLLTAHRTDLLRVPGIGPRTAERLVAARTRARSWNLRDCAGCGVNLRRAGPTCSWEGGPLAQRPLSDFRL